MSPRRWPLLPVTIALVAVVVIAVEAGLRDVPAASPLLPSAVAVLSGALVIAAVLVLALGRQLRRIAAAARRMATGDLTTAIDVSGVAEVAEVGAAFDQLRTQIAVHVEARERDAMQLELELVQVERTRRTIEHDDPMANLGLLAAGIAHELSNPMTAVLSSVTYARDALADPIPDHADIDDALRDARAAADRILQVLTELKAVARDDRAATHGFAVGDVLDRVVELVAPQAAARCRLVRVEALDLPSVAGDDDRLAQAVLSLVVNAVQAFGTDDQDRNTITITATAQDRDVVIEVADNGPGIALRHLPHVFEPFYTTRTGVCSGLGLTVAQAMIRAMGGELTVASKPGRGANFEIRLRVFDGTVPHRTLRAQRTRSRAHA